MSIDNNYQKFDNLKDLKDAVVQAKIIRDADKLDIFKVFIDEKFLLKERHKYNNNGYNEINLKSLKDGELVKYSNTNTYLDQLIYTLGMANGLYFDISKQMFLSENYAQKFYDVYSQNLTPNEKNVLYEAINIVKDNL